MKKYLLFTFFVLLCFNTSADFRTSGNFRPVKIVRTYADYDGKDQMTFSYSKDGLLLKIDYSYYYKTYEYDEKNRVSRISTWYNRTLSIAVFRSVASSCTKLFGQCLTRSFLSACMDH